MLIAVAVSCFLQPLLFASLFAAASGAEWANRATLHWHDPAMEIYLNGSIGQVLAANAGIGQWPKWWFILESGRVFQIMGLYLTGMVLGRIGFFARLSEFARARRMALAIAAGGAVLLYFVRGPLYGWFAGLGLREGAGRAFGALLGSWFELAGTATWALLLIAVYQSGLRWLVQPFAAPGRLTLTLYIAQSLIFVPIFYGFGLGAWDDWSQATRLGVALGAIAFQLWFAAAWLKRFQYGPIEWLWRAATFWRGDIPFRRGVLAAAQ